MPSAHELERKPTPEEYRQAARAMYQDEGTLEIDDSALVSEGDEDGAYVQAWVWVSKSETEARRKGRIEPCPQRRVWNCAACGSSQRP
jgi:hypothetical protein